MKRSAVSYRLSVPHLIPPLAKEESPQGGVVEVAAESWRHGPR
jgi:hypothetical protein